MRDRRTNKKGQVYSPTGVLLKKMGAKRGPLDYFFPVRRARFVGMAFEMKAPGGDMTDEQSDWADHLLQQGWHVPGPFTDWSEAARAVQAYLVLPLPT